LRGDRFGDIGALAGAGWEAAVPTLELLSHMMLYANPAVHCRVRNLAARNFPGGGLSAYRQVFEEVSDSLLDGLEDSGFDLIADYARPFSVRAIAGMFGMTAEERDTFRSWWYECMAALKDALAELPADPAVAARLDELTAQLRGYIAREVRRGHGVVAALAAAEHEGTRMTEDELLANCILLLSVGQDSVRHVIGTAMLALARHPQEYRKLREDRTLLESAVEEFLRFESPVQSVGRRAEEDTEIGQKPISRGEHVLLMLGAANRDPAQFQAPDCLDIARSPNRHLAFAYGPHFCLGAAIARMELQVAIGALLERMPELRPDCARLEWDTHRSSRGLAKLPMRRAA
jgi:cytochrome P450